MKIKTLSLIAGILSCPLVSALGANSVSASSLNVSQPVQESVAFTVAERQVYEDLGFEYVMVESASDLSEEDWLLIEEYDLGVIEEAEFEALSAAEQQELESAGILALGDEDLSVSALGADYTYVVVEDAALLSDDDWDWIESNDLEVIEEADLEMLSEAELEDLEAEGVLYLDE